MRGKHLAYHEPTRSRFDQVSGCWITTGCSAIMPSKQAVSTRIGGDNWRRKGCDPRWLVRVPPFGGKHYASRMWISMPCLSLVCSGIGHDRKSTHVDIDLTGSLIRSNSTLKSCVKHFLPAAHLGHLKRIWLSATALSWHCNCPMCEQGQSTWSLSTNK
jgi:hypothetical protein